MGPIGGAGMSLAANIGLGVLQGALVGGLDAALWGTNVGKGFLWGGISGGAFATLTSDNMGNLLKGKGFKSNEGIFKDFAAGKYTLEGGTWQQDAIDYFGFGGKYDNTIESDYFQSGEYYGATNSVTRKMSYGNSAFEDYKTLKAIYYKEVFHSKKILNNRPLMKLPESVQGLGMDLYLEEIDGYMFAFKNQGLYPKSNFPFRGVGQYQSQLFLYGVIYPDYPSVNWFYKIPRRW